MATKKPKAPYLSGNSGADLDALDDFIGGLKAPPAEAPPDGWMRRYLGDTAASLGRGAVQGVRMLADTAGADNAVSGGLRSMEDYIGSLQSASAKRDQQEIARILKEAEGKGVLDQVVAGVKAFGTAPLQTMAQAAGTSIPTIAAALIPGVGPAAVAARFAAPLAMGSAQGVGTVKASIYDEVKRAALDAGDTPEVAEAKAVQAQAYDGQNTNQIALGGALGAWAGKSGLEGAAQRLAYGTGGKAVPGMVSRVAMGAVAEGIPEAAQGGQEKFASNSALNNAGFKTDPMSGVFANATMEGLAGHAMGGVMGIPKPGGAPAPVVDPGQAIRATKLPEGGPMTRAANAATEAQARAADAGAPPLEFTATELPAGKGDGMALADKPDTTALDFEADPRFAGAMTFNNGAAPDQPVFPSKTLADIHIGEQGAMGELEAVEAAPGQWTVKQTDQAANKLARTNIEQWMAKAQPMPEERARGMVKDAEAQLGKKMTALPMPDGSGWTVVPTQWVSAPILMDYVEHASAAEQAAAEQADRASKAAAEPVKRAPRTPSTAAVAIDPAAPNAVAQFIAKQAGINTPAARAFVQGYRAGRITDADVLARIMPKKDSEPSADERIAAAAAQAPAPASGLILNREGQPFKSERAAAIAQKKHAGSSVVVVPGGHAVRRATDANPAAAAADTGASDDKAQAASVPAAVDPAAVEEGADPAGAGATEAPATGAAGGANGAAAAMEANGLKKGDPVTMHGKQWTVADATPEFVTLTDGAGGTRTVAAGSKSLIPIQKPEGGAATAQINDAIGGSEAAGGKLPAATLQPTDKESLSVAAAAQAQPAPAADGAKADKFYGSLIGKASTEQLSSSGGRTLHRVKITPEMRGKHYDFRKGRFPETANFELKPAADVTGNPYDSGYILIDKRVQAKMRAAPAGSADTPGSEQAEPDAAAGGAVEADGGNKVGDLVKLTKPGVNGRVNITGTIRTILPDGRLEVKTQQDGYFKVLPSELGHKPAQPVADASTNGKKQNTSAERVQKTPESEQVAPPKRTEARGKAKHPQTVMGSRILALVSDRLGGLDPAWISQFSHKQETKSKDKNGLPRIQWRNPLIPGVGKLFRSGGTQDLQLLAETMEQAGYLPPGSVEADGKEAGETAMQIVRDALNRAEAQTQDEIVAEREADDKAGRDAYYAELDAESAAEAETERQAIMAENSIDPARMDATEDDDIPWDTPGLSGAAGMRSTGFFSEQEIQDAYPAEREDREALQQDRAGGQDGQDAAQTAQAPAEPGALAPGPAGQAEGLSDTREFDLAGASWRITLTRHSDGDITWRAEKKTANAVGGAEWATWDRVAGDKVPASVAKRASEFRDSAVDAAAPNLLTMQTPADLKAKTDREAAAEKAERDKKGAEQTRLRKDAEALDLKARADQSVNDFQLGQSADQQMSGMDDMFADAPPAQQSPSAEAAAILDAAAEPPKGAERLRVIKDVKSGAITPDEVAAAYPAAQEAAPAAADDAPSKIEDVGEKIGGARKDTAISTGASRKRANDDDRPAWARRFGISQIVTQGGMVGEVKDAGRWVIRDSRSLDWAGQPKQVGRITYATKEEAEAVVPLAAVAMKHRVVMASTKKGDPDRYEIWRDINDRKRVQVVQQQFESREEAAAYMLANAVQIIETNTTFGEADLPLPPDRARKGVERRTGNANGQDFKDTFGLRGVEFGNWNNQDERQALMNDAWDGLMDLAEVLNVPPKAMGMNGDLALAFGARGHGLNSARAHYEPARAVINLTKESGAGSLAHEWFHGLDHYFGRQDGKASATWKVGEDGTRTLDVQGDGAEMVSSGFRGERSGVRPELRAAYDTMLRTMTKKAETYVEDTAKADKFTAVTREELARALTMLRTELADQKDVQYYKRNNKPASAELLAEFDAIAKRMLDGAVDALSTDWKSLAKGGQRGPAMAVRWSNDSLDRMSAIYKEVRGRSGFDGTNKQGVMDRLRGNMDRYSQRLKMLADAQSGAGKVRAVPTDFAMNARELDQGRGTDYWTTPHEMAARAFQGYVEDKIAERGGMSRFLNYAPENSVILTPWGFKRPYPAGEERKAINGALDKFIGALQTRTDDAGNVAMFSRAPGVRAALDDAIAAKEAFDVADGAANVVEDADAYFALSEKASDARDSLAEKLASQADDGFVLQGRSSFGRMVMVNGSAQQPGQWQITRFDDEGEPLGDGQYTTKRKAVDDFLREIDLASLQDFDGVFSRAEGQQQGQPASSARRQAVEALVQQIAARWANAPEVVVVESLDDPRVPEAVRREERTQQSKAGAGAPEGFFHEGKVYLIAEQLPGDADVVRVLFHEALGHFGLRGTFGPALGGILDRVAVLNAAKVRAKAKQYGLDYDKPSDRRAAAEEVLAEMAQRTPDIGWGAKAVAAVRTWLRAHVPGFRQMALSDAEIVRSFIIPARAFVQRGGPAAGGGGAAFSRASGGATSTEAFKAWFGKSKVVDEQGKPLVVYHGTASDITTFRTTRTGEFGPAIYTTSDPNEATQYGAGQGGGLLVPVNVMPLYVSLQNPFTDGVTAFWKRFSSENQTDDQAVKRAIDAGFDGVIELRKDWRDKTFTHYIAFNPEQIKSATGNSGAFDPANADIRYSRASIADAVNGIADRFNKGPSIVGETGRKYTPSQLAAMRNVGFQTEPQTIQERAKALWADAGKSLAQGLVDQFAPVKAISEQAYGLLRLSKGASGAFEALLQGGKLKISDGVYDFDASQRGGVVETLFKPLNGEHHDFLRWVAANRADRLMGVGKENLFTPEDVASLKSLADGDVSFDYTIRNGDQAGQVTRSRSRIYADSLGTFNAFNTNVLDMAEESGLIDGEARNLWENEFYVPFYRVEEDGNIAGANIKNGAVRQQAFRSLTGRTNKLNADLLDNTLMNWAHLLDAGAKNRAAKASIEAAEKMGAAEIVDGPSGKGTVWFRENGDKRYSFVSDPHLLTAISALEYAGMRNPVMNAMSAFKRVLTVGVTASPFFKIRNLIRDSVQAVGTGNLSYNIAANVAQGWKLTDPSSDSHFRLLAGGGTIHFGTMMEGNEAKRVQALVESGVDAAHILDSDHKVKAFYRKFIEPGITAYNELGNRGEGINRASLYDQLTKQGMSHAEASLQARDLMDFSMQGSFTSIRFLTQVVPFLNARIQGLYKLGRAAKEDPARFSAVLGAVTLMSLALLAAYSDDDDWKKREEWDRNNFWWFKIGGTALRIPKPFEIGAIATLAERGFELAFDKEMTGSRFRKQVLTLFGDSLSMNPIPQMVKPIMDVYANKNSFTGRPIETMGMEKLKPEYRVTEGTTVAAKGISAAANAAAGIIGAEAYSPVQVDSLLRGYFGWLGSFVVGAGDVVARMVSDQPAKATPDYWKAATGGIVSDLKDAPSRYVSQMYEQASVVEKAYGTWQMLRKQGRTAEAAEFQSENLDDINKHREIGRIKQTEARLNSRIRSIQMSDRPADEKRELIRSIQVQKDKVARVMVPAG